MLNETDVRSELNRVIHPSFGMSLVALRMVESIRVEGAQIEVDLVMNCPGCPASEATLTKARERLTARCSEAEIRFQLLPKTWAPPWNSRY